VDDREAEVAVDGAVAMPGEVLRGGRDPAVPEPADLCGTENAGALRPVSESPHAEDRIAVGHDDVDARTECPVVSDGAGFLRGCARCSICDTFVVGESDPVRIGEVCSGSSQAVANS